MTSENKKQKTKNEIKLFIRLVESGVVFAFLPSVRVRPTADDDKSEQIQYYINDDGMMGHYVENIVFLLDNLIHERWQQRAEGDTKVIEMNWK